MKKILKLLVVSDGTGETASAMLRAAMTQFGDKDVYFTRFKDIRKQEQIDSIIDEFHTTHHILAYTIVSKELRMYMEDKARKHHLRTIDLFGPILTAFSNYFDEDPLSEPGLYHSVNDNYFQRVAAMEFTLNHDDGRNLSSLHLADVVLVGISRTSKTPLSIYLSLRGLKVVNVPLICGMNPPEELFKIDQRRIFALTIDPDSLLEIRKNRLGKLGAGQFKGDYADYNKVEEEVEWANKIFAQNKRWPVFNVTLKAVEETASEILKIIQNRAQNQFER